MGDAEGGSVGVARQSREVKVDRAIVEIQKWKQQLVEQLVAVDTVAQVRAANRAAGPSRVSTIARRIGVQQQNSSQKQMHEVWLGVAGVGRIGRTGVGRGPITRDPRTSRPPEA